MKLILRLLKASGVDAEFLQQYLDHLGIWTDGEISPVLVGFEDFVAETYTLIAYEDAWACDQPSNPVLALPAKRAAQ